MAAKTLKHRHSVSAGIAWLASQSVLRQVISFGLFVVLGRLLNPIDFGTVGLCASIIMILQSIASYGVSSAVVQKAELTDEEANVAYTINWLIAGAISLVILSTALILGTFSFHGDSFPYVLGVLALSPLLVVLVVELLIVVLASPWRPKLMIECERLGQAGISDRLLVLPDQDLLSVLQRDAFGTDRGGYDRFAEGRRFDQFQSRSAAPCYRTANDARRTIQLFEVSHPTIPGNSTPAGAELNDLID